MNHLEVWQHEKLSECDQSMAAWLYWVQNVQRAAGISNLDGDDLTVGYSYGTASDFFDCGISAQAAAEIFLLRRAQVTLKESVCMSMTK